MANRDLLKEAIADAKSVKEAAIANAKAALEEAFTPYLQEKFAAKLAEMEMEEEEDVKEEMTDENYGKDLEEKMSNPVMRRGLEGDDAEELETEKMRDKNMEEELDLEELLAELDEEMETEGMEEKTEESLNEAEEEEETEEEESEEEVEGEDEEIDLEDMSEEDLKALIEDVIADMVAAGELEAGENFEEEEGDEDEEEIDINMEDEESEEETMDELLKEEEVNEIDIPSAVELSSFALKNPEQAMAAAIAGILGISAGATAAQELAKKAIAFVKGKKATSETEVEEMRTELEELASTLSEVKLLNAKLLYTNKIFRAKNLNETQKVKVLEAFDKATSVSDAKLIYETLTTVKETKTAVTESMRGMASKAVGVAPEKKPILEVNDQFARWQILAGIKK